MMNRVCAPPLSVYFLPLFVLPPSFYWDFLSHISYGYPPLTRVSSPPFPLNFSSPTPLLLSFPPHLNLISAFSSHPFPFDFLHLPVLSPSHSFEQVAPPLPLKPLIQLPALPPPNPFFHWSLLPEDLNPSNPVSILPGPSPYTIGFSSLPSSPDSQTPHTTSRVFLFVKSHPSDFPPLSTSTCFFYFPRFFSFFSRLFESSPCFDGTVARDLRQTSPPFAAYPFSLKDLASFCLHCPRDNFPYFFPQKPQGGSRS